MVGLCEIFKIIHKKHAECYPAYFLITGYLVTLSLLYY
nr:MAG TPA: hypothetical protein [Inoviridae sp.]